MFWEVCKMMGLDTRSEGASAGSALGTSTRARCISTAGCSERAESMAAPAGTRPFGQGQSLCDASYKKGLGLEPAASLAPSPKSYGQPGLWPSEPERCHSPPGGCSDLVCTR